MRTTDEQYPRVRLPSSGLMTPSIGPLVLLLIIALSAGTSCAESRMLPATSAHVVPGAPETAAAEAAGVRVSADGDDWTARPEDLAKRLTPVKVRIVNHSGAPAIITCEQFSLIGNHGRVYRAIPLVPLDHQQPLDGAGAIHPLYATSKFFVAPRLHDIYPTLAAWSRPLAWDASAVDERFHLWGPDLPTRTMQRLGLPEGVLADGGEISGFLYFENATKREGHLTFRADLEDEQDGTSLAQIEIPFRVQ